jgi:hypothetical protein
MALIDIDFEWWRDEAGYRLVDPEPANPKPAIHPVYGFEIEPTLLELIGKPQRVLPNGGRRIAYRPLRKFDRLCKGFASLKTSADVLRFIQAYGPLTDRGFHPEQGEEVAYVLDHAAKFRGWLSGSSSNQLNEWIGKEGAVFANLQACLRQDASGMLSLCILPKSLLGGLWLQLAAMLASGESIIRACGFCGRWFTAGPDTRRRLDAKFCSDEHRVAFNSLKRSRGK